MNMKMITANKIASYATKFFTTVLRVEANSASSCVVYQPKAPATLKKFSKIKWFPEYPF